MKLKLTEAQIQRQIVDYLEKAHGAKVLQNRSSGKLSHLVDRRAKGSPDLVAAMPKGVTLWIEVKKPGGRQSGEQLAWRWLLQQLGHHVLIASSVDAVILFMERGDA